MYSNAPSSWRKRDEKTRFSAGNCEIASFYTTDLSLRWRGIRNLEIFGSIQNVFDRVAPLDPLTYGAVSFNPLDISGAVGRYYSLGLKYTFK